MGPSYSVVGCVQKAPLLSASAGSSAAQQTVTLHNIANLKKSTLHLSRTQNRYAVRFTFDAECAVRVTVRFAVSEVLAAAATDAKGAANANATLTWDYNPNVYTPKSYEV